jgi:proteic killer suppression protein
MIQGFADSEAELIWSGRRSRKLPAEIRNVALRKLRLLNQARVLGDLRVPPREPPRGAEGGSAGTALDPNQRSMAHLLCLG